jgi:hypothetical protein
MTTNIIETLPWIDYREVFEKLEARGKSERDMEIALNAFKNADAGIAATIGFLKAAGISDETIRAAKERATPEN